MAASITFRFPLVLAAGLACIGLMPFAAGAVSRRDQASLDALNQRMTTAEQKYRAAVVKIGNADPTGQSEADSALEDMEDVIAACLQQKGCSVPTMLTTYKRLLKVNADAESQVADGGDDDSDDGDDHIGTTLTGDVPEAARAAQLLADDHRFDQMVQYNPAVQAGIRRWLTDMRPALMDSYENYEYLRHLMWPQYERAGLPEALLFGIMAKESNGKVHVSSRAGAAGPMQFMYNTGKRFGLGPDGTGFDTRFDARSAAEASAAYLNERMGELNRSIELALAAYNGGEGRALRVYQGGGGRGFWDASVYNQFPPETRDYVPMVVAAAWLFLHPKQYGITFPKVEAKPAMLKLSRPASIYELTICLGNGGTREGYMRALRNLNPRYEADSWLPAGASLNATTKIVGLYNRHCTQGKRADLAHQLVVSDPAMAVVRVGDMQMVGGVTTPATPVAVAADAKPAAKPAKKKTYKVRSGETLTAISRKFSCDTRELAQANKIKAPRYAIRPGQTLSLEGCTAD
jgi:membrane-bound lytic murein transglycosylase D